MDSAYENGISTPISQLKKKTSTFHLTSEGFADQDKCWS